MSSVAQLKSAG